MTISLRRPTDPPETPAEKPAKRTKQPKAAVPATAPELEGLVIGGDPRVDLLPPEVRSARRNARTRRGFTWGVLAVLLVVVMAVAGAFGLNVMAQAQMLAAQARTNDLLAQQQKYVQVRNVQNQVDIAAAAQQVGASTEVDWESFITAIGTVEPAGLKMTSTTVDSASPIAVYQQSTDPLQGPRIATVTVVTASAGFPDISAWVTSIQKIKGVADVSAGAVNRDETGVYTSTVVIHLSDEWFTKRFETKGK